MDILFENFVFFATIVLIYMTFWYFISLIFKRNDVADIAWGLGFLLLAVFSFLQGTPEFGRPFIVTLLIVLWALRLAVHIFLRNKGKTEDYRYKAWREQWGKWFYIRSYLQVFILQGIFMLIISSAFLIVNIFDCSCSFGILDIVGILIWLIGFFFEAVGDWQLVQFMKTKKKGEILQTGLWKYSRHPNYFGEVMQWWGIWFIAISVDYGLLGIVSPLLITVLILKVSGVPLLEKNMEKNPAFKEYKKKVSVFIPLPPKV